MTEEIAVIAVLVILAALAGVALFRVRKIRGAGTPAILRKMPAGPGDRWRHGVIRYGEGSLVFYQLTSIRPGPDVHMDRQTIEVIARRRPMDSEHDLMSDATVVTEIRGELIGGGQTRVLEIAMESGAFTAFMSWVESRPSGRSLRGRPS
ncbi:hypothetical protein GCM10007304_13960 [Rhodococcoides trifolii]|uniref:DUF2550 family protein n=1 Tax=Rhodococcoides trifolii TaxID=908250 RepID=A0A917FU00_9NOCA|nr:DUF2550 domain-containing protein [Rhodococcus trifolii]GGG01163.1 hypothetical protein GCM10007304_13960 [Rhodococcus trifolii]